MIFKTQLGNNRDAKFVKTKSGMHEYRMHLQAKKAEQLAESKAVDPNRFMRQDKVMALQNERAKSLKHLNESNELYSQLKVDYLVNTLSEVFINALPLDEDYKQLHESGLVQVFGQELANLSESPDALLKEMQNGNSYLQDLAEAVLTEAKKECVKKQSESFKDNDDEESEKKVDVVGSVEASDIIKNKVLKVLDDENARSEEEKAIHDELNDRGLSENYTVNFNTRGIRHYSLFRSLQIDTYKKALHKVNGLNESTAIASRSDEGQISVDNDAVLAEAIIRYTLLETFNTLGLKAFNVRNTTKLSDDIAYRRYK